MTTTVALNTAPNPSLAGNVARHEEAHSEFFFDSYSDFADPDEQVTKQMPAESYVASTICTSDFCCNQQYSVTAITTAAGAIAERYAYTAYGLPTILNASATIIASSAISNRYTYTGREWDATLALHHFRARWMSPIAGRFLGRDPIGYEGSEWGLYEVFEGGAVSAIDPLGLSIPPSTDEVSSTYFCMGVNWHGFWVAAGSCTCSFPRRRTPLRGPSYWGAMNTCESIACPASGHGCQGVGPWQPSIMEGSMQRCLRARFGPSVTCTCT